MRSRRRGRRNLYIGWGTYAEVAWAAEQASSDRSRVILPVCPRGRVPSRNSTLSPHTSAIHSRVPFPLRTCAPTPAWAIFLSQLTQRSQPVCNRNHVAGQKFLQNYGANSAPALCREVGQCQRSIPCPSRHHSWTSPAQVGLLLGLRTTSVIPGTTA